MTENVAPFAIAACRPSHIHGSKVVLGWTGLSSSSLSLMGDSMRKDFLSMTAKLWVLSLPAQYLHASRRRAGHQIGPTNISRSKTSPKQFLQAMNCHAIHRGNKHPCVCMAVI